MGERADGGRRAQHPAASKTLERTGRRASQVDPMEARADVRAAAKNVVAADRDRKSVDYMFVPTLYLVSNLDYTNWAVASVNDEHLSWNVGGQLAWNLYDGGDRYAQRHFNEAALTIARETLTQKKRDVDAPGRFKPTVGSLSRQANSSSRPARATSRRSKRDFHGWRSSTAGSNEVSTRRQRAPAATSRDRSCSSRTSRIFQARLTASPGLRKLRHLTHPLKPTWSNASSAQRGAFPFSVELSGAVQF